MLSIHNIANASGGADYYLKTAEYYQGEGNIEKPAFQGKHIDCLIGGDKFTVEKFTKLLNGELPNGKRLGKTEKGEINHRPGVDLTFSAPKSLSILALVDNRVDLVDAHNRAVTETLKYVEKNLTFTRNNGVHEKVDNINVVKFLQTLSRENDPQLHTHCVVLNMLMRKDGHWRSMTSEALYENKMMLGQLYRSSLAKSLFDMGYDLNVNKADGTFEIRGVPSDLMQQLSKRREVIESIAEKTGITSAAGMQAISTNSRKKAPIVSKQDLMKRWQGEVEMMKVDLSQIQPDPNREITQPNKKKIAKDAVCAAINKLDTSLRFYTKEKVMYHAMLQSVDKAVCPIEIEQALNAAIRKNALMPITEDKSLYISGITYQAEIRLREAVSTTWEIRHLHIGSRIKEAFYKWAIKDIWRIDNLSRALNANQQVSIVDNFMSAHDNKALYRILKLSKSYGKPISVLALSSVDRANLYANGIYSIGLDKYIKKNAANNGVVIVCGSEKATIQQMDRLITCAKSNNTKVILLNAKDHAFVDTRYSPVELLAESGIERVSMREMGGIGAMGINILSQAKKVIEVDNMQGMASHFTRRQSGIIISADHARLNSAIREAIFSQVAPGDKAVMLNNYTPMYMTDTEMNRSVNYMVGDLLKIDNLKILGFLKTKGIEEGDHFKVMNIGGNQLTIEHGRLKQAFTLDLDKERVSFEDFSVYKDKKMEIRTGDRVILPRDNIYGKALINRLGTVTKVTDNYIVIDVGRLLDFKLYTKDKDTFLERGFAVAAHRPVNEWKGDIDLHLSPESMRNVLKNLSDEKIDRVRNLYVKDHKEIIKTLEQMSSKIEFASGENRQIVVENSIGEPIAEIMKEFKQIRQDRDRLSENAVEIAVRMITEKEFEFSAEDVFREAGAISVGGLNPKEIAKAIDRKVDSGELVNLKMQDGKIKYSTQELLSKKAMALDSTAERVNSICSVDRFYKKVSDLKIDIPEEHQVLVKGLLSSESAVSIVQGFAGTAKTSLTVKTFADIAKSEGYDVRGYSPTHSACVELRSKAGIDTKTVESAMQPIYKGKFHVNSKTIVIVDESSMLSLNNTVSLINACAARGARLVFVGDKNQQPSIGAGEIFRDLVDSGKADVHYIRGIMRQKTPAYREAIQNLANGHVQAFFDGMKDSIIEVKGKDGEVAPLEAVVGSISQEYADTSKHTRDVTQIITLTNAAKNEINQKVRDLLIQKYDLSENKVVLKTYESVDHSDATKHFASKLAVGNAIRFNVSDERYGIHSGEYLTIVEISDKDNMLTFAREDGTLLPHRPDRSSLMRRGGLEVYKQTDKPLAIGEKIIFRRSIEDVGILNTDMAKITAIQGTVATIQLKDRVLDLDLSKPGNRHWDYGYAITSHVFQGKDCETVFCHFDTRAKPIANYQSFYVASTRGEYSMKVFTDSIETAKNNVLSTYLQKNPTYQKIVFHDQASGAPDVITDHQSSTIKVQLVDHIERKRFSESAALICRSILGEPLKIRGTTFYYGKKGGSMRVETAGEKAGLWNDFASGDGGDIIGLIKHQTGSNFKDSVDIVRKIVGDGYGPLDYSVSANSVENTSKMSDITEKTHRARDIFNSGILVAGTVGEKYLIEHRKIPADVIEKASTEIRFIVEFQFDIKSNRKFNALAFAARNAREEVQAVQVVLLDPQTGQKLEGQSKYSFGAMKGASLMLGKQGSEVYIAEGPETALSVFAAKPNADVRAVFSVENIKNTFIPLSTNAVIICADNDGAGAPTEKAIVKAVDALKAQVHSVSVVMPFEVGKDFNDLMKQGGVNAVDYGINPKCMSIDSLEVQKNREMIF